MKKFVQQREPRIPFTQEGYDKIIVERAQLLRERPDAVEHLRKSREMGDLSENGYYKASRQRLNFVDARIRRVERLIKLAIIVATHDTGLVEIGSTVTLLTGTIEMTFTIVGGYESDPTNHTISYVSPIGKALMNKKVGDTVQVIAPKATISYTIKAIT